MTTAGQSPAQARPQAVPAPRAPILVVSRDERLLPAMQKTLGGTCPLHQTKSIQEALELVKKHRFGVLIADLAAEEREVMEITHILSTYSPNLVCIVISEREHAHDLMSLVNSGYIYRFLLKPIATGQTRLTVQAALRQHHTLRQNPPRPPLPPPSNQTDEEVESEESYGVMDVLEDILEDNEHLRSLFLGGAALIVALALGLTWYFSSGTDDDEATEQIVTTSEPLVPDPVREQALPAGLAETESLLQKANEALQAGRLLTPEQDNANYYYSSALETDPGNLDAGEGLDRLTEIILTRAEDALKADEFENAIALVQNARNIRPDHPRIEAVDTLIHDYGEQWLAQAEQPAAPASETPRAAAPARATPAAVEPEDPTPAVAVPALPEPQAVAAVAAPLPQPKPRTPPPTSPATPDPAPSSPAAREAIAETTAPEPFPETTRVPLPKPETVQPQPPRPAAEAPPAIPSGEVSTETMINDMSRLANRRMDEGRLLQPTRDNALFYVQALLRAAPGNPAVSRDKDRLASLFLARASTAMADEQFDVAERWLTQAKALEVPAVARSTPADLATPSSATPSSATPSSATPSPAPVTARLAPALQGVPGLPAPGSPQPSTPRQAAGPSAPDVSAGVVPPAIPIARTEPVPVSELQFKKYVEPKYPRSAYVRNMNGWVDLEFTVSTEGRPKDIQIGEAEPPNQFEEAAIDALRKWEFEPELVDGQRVEKRAKVRVRFQVE